MKHAIRYLFILAGALLSGACAQEGPEGAADGEGTLTLRLLTGTRADGDGYDARDYGSVRIYNAEGLIRAYACSPESPMPESLDLSLRAGEYTIEAEAGDRTPASFDRRSYAGKETFTVAAGEKRELEVRCKLLNSLVEVRFDETIRRNFGTDFRADLCAAETFDAEAVESGRVPSLRFTDDGEGCFLPDEGTETICWRFTGTHAERGEITKTGFIGEVKPAGKYILTLRYSKDLGGEVSFTLEIDDTTDDSDDVILVNPAPSIRWGGNDLEERYPMSEGMQVALEIKAFNGIEALRAQIASPVLTAETLAEMHLAPEMDLVHPASEEMAAQLTALGFPAGATIAGEKNLRFDLAGFVAELLARCKGYDTCDHDLTLRATDRLGRESVVTLRLQYVKTINTALYNRDADLWANTGTMTLTLEAGTAADRVGLRYRRTGDTQWQHAALAALDEGRFTASIAPVWSEGTNAAGLTIHTVDPSTGLFAGRTYEYELLLDGEAVDTGTFSTEQGDAIPNAGMEQWSTYNVVGGTFTGGSVPYPNASGDTVGWTSGNNKQTNGLCTGSDFEGHNGERCARLQGATAFGIFAAGNLFTGHFECGTGTFDTFGFASFGHKYRFSARPTALRLRCHATITPITNKGSIDDTHAVGDTDPARILVCIVDWTAQHRVKSGASADVKTFWNPENTTDPGEGPILGYGTLNLETSTDGWTELTLPISYYDPAGTPAADNYSLVISCSASAYGDYLTGSTNNVLYVEDFEWVY